MIGDAWTRYRLLTRWCVGKETAHGFRVLTTPAVHDICVGMVRGRVERGEDRSEHALLRTQERPRVVPGARVEHELEQQLGAHVAEVLDGRGEPALDLAPPTRGRGEDRATRAVARLCARRSDEPPRFEVVDRPVRERARQRPDAADLAAGRERAHDRPTVTRLLGEQREDRVLTEGGGGTTSLRA